MVPERLNDKSLARCFANGQVVAKIGIGARRARIFFR